MITAWSPSRLNTYEQCPKRAYYEYVRKHKSPQGKAASEGSRIHALAAQYLQGELAELPRELNNFAAEFRGLREAKHAVLCEQQQAFTSGMVSTSWFAPDAWLRVIYDVIEVKPDGITITDWKTGKVRAKDLEQLELYACTAFVLYPTAERITTRLGYITPGLEYEVQYTRAECAELWPSWVERATEMLTETQFPARPGPLCGWCFHSSRRADEVDARYKAEGIDAKSTRLCEEG